MLSEYLHSTAEKLIRAFGDSPFEIAEGIGIKVILNYEFSKLCGMYTVIKRRRIIILNGNMDSRRQKTVLAHEIGHDILHRHMAQNKVVHDVMVYDMSIKPEYEANMFASELLLRDADVLALLEKDGYSAEQAAAALDADINLMLIKLSSMQKRGFKFDSVPLPADSRFISEL